MMEQTGEANSDHLLGDYGIEQIKNIAPIVSEMTNEEKEIFLSEAELTEEANKERRKRGISELHVLGWIQEPILDKNKMEYCLRCLK